MSQSHTSQDTKNRYLLIKHSEGWNVDRCRLWMDKAGHDYDWCYPVSGQSLPSVELYDGVMIFGGAGSANDCQENAWVREELKFIESCLSHGKPFFGICLGAQMLARVLGSSVSPHAEQQKEIGFMEVRPTAAGTHFLSQPLNFMQWHSEGFELPSGCVNLACSDLFPNQAFSVNEHTIGVQFHPEVNLDVLKLWHERNKTRPTGVLNDAQRAQHVLDAEVWEDRITEWLDGFLTNWTHLASKAA